tara:strand:+ start:67 stop:1020 length:954 start_codon:yes stop_codon:yes gene_type:complete
MKIKKYTKQIIILIFLLIFIYLIFKHLENYSNNSDTNIKFIEKNVLYNFYNNLDYLKKMKSVNKKARNLEHKNLVHFYSENIHNFNKKQIYLLKTLTTIINKHIDNQKIKNDWNYVLFKNIENNYPHTHKKFIFLPLQFINSINSNMSILDNKYVINTLIHEKIHVLQRLYTKKFEQLYKLWHLKQVNNIKNIDKLNNLVRDNPDGQSKNWVFEYNNKIIWFNCIFNSTNVNNISQVKNVGILLKKQANEYIMISKPINLMNIYEFKHFFGNLNGNFYHPNELSAEIGADYLCSKLNISKNYNSKAAYIFEKWFDSF